MSPRQSQQEYSFYKMPMEPSDGHMADVDFRQSSFFEPDGNLSRRQPRDCVESRRKERYVYRDSLKERDSEEEEEEEAETFAQYCKKFQ